MNRIAIVSSLPLPISEAPRPGKWAKHIEAAMRCAPEREWVFLTKKTRRSQADSFANNLRTGKVKGSSPGTLSVRVIHTAEYEYKVFVSRRLGLQTTR